MLIAVNFDSNVFTASGCTLSVEDSIAYYNNSIKMLKTAGQSSCYFEILNTTATSFNSAIEDRGELRIYIPQDEFRNLATSGRAISVYFGSNADLTTNYNRYDFLIGQLSPGWNTLTFDFSTVPSGDLGTSSGTLTTTAVKSYRFEALFSNAVPEVDLYWDHLVSLDVGTPTPAVGSVGTTFNASTEAIWQYRVTFVNEYGTESNVGPSSVEIDLTSSVGFNDVVKETFDSATGWTAAQGSVSADTGTKTEGTASEIITTASVGIALYPADGTDSETLVRNADSAMYPRRRRAATSAPSTPPR